MYSMPSSHQQTEWIRQQALSLGFEFCGFSKAVRLDDDARRLERWLRQGMQAGMDYMERYFDMRVDPSQLVPGARSVITLLLSYYPEHHQHPQAPKISKYAFGKDYHPVIRTKLNALLTLIRSEIGAVEGRGFVDSAPVLERSWAQRSGLGWIGKNGNLIHPRAGSFFFIATLIVDLDLEPDDPLGQDFCGTCRKCIDACPTGAILEDKVIDARKCISYYTIELKDALIPEPLQGTFDDWMFGCDTCQDVCPWNRFSRITREESFQPLPEILNLSRGDWEQLSETRFRELFKDSPLKRAKYSGIRRNLTFLKVGSLNPPDTTPGGD